MKTSSIAFQFPREPSGSTRQLQAEGRPRPAHVMHSPGSVSTDNKPADVTPVAAGGVPSTVTPGSGRGVIDFRARISRTGWADLEVGIARLRASASGPPRHREILGELMYKEVVGQRLKNPTLLWANRDKLAELGINLRASEIPPQLEAALFEAFAYAIPRPTGEDDHAVVPKQTKTLYADYQGGEGNWGTLGSGRASSIGQWSVKGGGDTGLSLKPAPTEPGSKIGGLNVFEGITEAIWGEVSSNLLPSGGNRILALIATGTYNEIDGKRSPRILAIREDPLRPAHFQAGELDREHDPQGRRVKAAVANIQGALPQHPRLSRSLASDVRWGLGYFVDRVATQYAAAFVRGIYHGATSPANIQLNGGFLDFDAQTAHPGHGKVNVLYSEAASGEMLEVKRLIIEQPLQDIYRHSDELPKRREAEAEIRGYLKRFDAVFDRTLEREFLGLTGAPVKLAEELYETNVGRTLARVIAELATLPPSGNARAHNIPFDGVGPGAMVNRTTEHDIGALLRALADAEDKSRAGLVAALAPRLGSTAEAEDIAEELAAAFEDFWAALVARAANDGVEERALRRYVQQRVRRINEPLHDLYRPILRDRIQRLVDRFEETADAGPIAAFIDETVRNNHRPWRDTAYEIVLSRRVEGGRLIERVYDAATDREYDRPA